MTTAAASRKVERGGRSKGSGSGCQAEEDSCGELHFRLVGEKRLLWLDSEEMQRLSYSAKRAEAWQRVEALTWLTALASSVEQQMRDEGGASWREHMRKYHQAAVRINIDSYVITGRSVHGWRKN